jgi:hypothetical protein
VNDNPARLRRHFGGQSALADFGECRAPALAFPARHPVLPCDVSERGWKMLQNAFELQPQSFEELAALRGIGAKSLRALALLSELLYGAEASWRDPVKYSFAHGGKDGFPYPVDRENYDASIGFLRSAVESARLGDAEKHGALKRLRGFA